jgi:hypothetical protein
MIPRVDSYPWRAWWGRDETLVRRISQRRSANGVFSVKLFWTHVQTLTWWLHAADARYQLPRRLFGGNVGRVLASADRRVEGTAFRRPFRTVIAPLAAWPRTDLTVPADNLPGDSRYVHSLLARAFPGHKYILLNRGDKLRQAISLARAQQTRVWHTTHDSEPRVEAPKFDIQTLDRLLIHLNTSTQRWYRYFEECGVKPHVVTYEDLAANPSGVIKAILDHLGYQEANVEHIAGQSRLKRQSDEITDSWISEYHRLRPSPLGVT